MRPSHSAMPSRALGEVTDAPGQPARGRAGPPIRLPGRVPLTAGLCVLLAGRIEGTLGSAETVLSGIERALGLLHRGEGTGERVLGCGRPAPQAGQSPDRLAAFPRPACHLTIVAGSPGSGRRQAPARPGQASSRRPGNAPQPSWHANSLTRSGCRTLAGLTSAVGAKLGANNHHFWATPGATKPSSAQLNGTSGHPRRCPATPQI